MNTKVRQQPVISTSAPPLSNDTVGLKQLGVRIIDTVGRNAASSEEMHPLTDIAVKDRDVFRRLGEKGYLLVTGQSGESWYIFVAKPEPAGPDEAVDYGEAKDVPVYLVIMEKSAWIPDWPAKLADLLRASLDPK